MLRLGKEGKEGKEGKRVGWQRKGLLTVEKGQVNKIYQTLNHLARREEEVLLICAVVS